jgi:hypothetical protein
MNQMAVTAGPLEAAVIGAVAVILGAVIALCASLATSRSIARSALVSSARPAVESLQKRFLGFRGEVHAERSVTKSGPRLEEILEEVWREDSSAATSEAATVTRGRARRALESAVMSLDWADELGQNGLGLEPTTRQDMRQIADDGFEVASVVLRNGRLPGARLRGLRKVRRRMRWLFVDFDEIASLQKGRPAAKSGLGRRVWRKMNRWSVARLATISKPFRRFFAYLFRP